MNLLDLIKEEKLLQVPSGAYGIAAKYTKKIPTKRQLIIEIQYYLSKIDEIERQGKHKSDLTGLWMEVVNLKDVYREGTFSSHYEKVLEVSTLEKQSLIKLFNNLNGYSWSKTFGWVGQSSVTSIRPEIQPFQSPASLFDGIDVKPLIAESTIHSSNQEDKVTPTTDITTHLNDMSKENTDDLITKMEVTMNGYVSGINLSSFGCNGQFANSLECLIHLESIELDYNGISGPLPMDIKNMSKLKKLSICANMLCDDLPSSILSNLCELQILNLSFNNLTGSIPDVFDKLPNITEINLSGNKFSGSLPYSFGSLYALKTLKIHSNELHGSIPDSYRSLQHLQYCDLSNNKLSEGIGNLFTCTELQHLNIKQNQMMDSIGRELGNLTKLTTLNLSYNQFHGIFDKNWCEMIELIRLNLSYNQLSGTLPEEICKLAKIECLILHQNHITGPIPRSISNLSETLRDFKLLSTFPSDSIYVAEAYDKKVFDRVYGFGPSTGIDNVHWKEVKTDDIDISKNITSLRISRK